MRKKKLLGHLGATDKSKKRLQIVLIQRRNLIHELLNSILDSGNLAHEFLGLGSGHAGGDDGTSDAAGATKGSLGRDEDVGDVLAETSADTERNLRKKGLNTPSLRTGEEDEAESREVPCPPSR